MQMPLTLNSLPHVLQPTETDIKLLLNANIERGMRVCTQTMQKYVYARGKNDPLYIISLEATWTKMVLAASVIAAVDDPETICCISGRPFGQRAIIKFAHAVQCNALSDRFTPGTFTNQITKQFVEPRLLIVTDPTIDSQPIKEASYVNIPVIAMCDTNNKLNYVDVAIPCNNKGKHAIGVIYWMLAREVLRMKGFSRDAEWDSIPIDLFFYRDPDEVPAVEEQQRQADQNIQNEWGATDQQVQGAQGQQQATKAGGDFGGEWEQQGVGGDQEWGAPTMGGDTQGGFAQQAPTQGGYDQGFGQQPPPAQQFDNGATWDQAAQPQTFGQQQQIQGGYQDNTFAQQSVPQETTWNQTDATTAAFDAPTAQPW